LFGAVNGAVHATSPAHSGWPRPPQNNTPDTHPPPWHWPRPPPHVIPEATQVPLFRLLSQQPPALQALPLQQGWPGPPHAVQLLPSHVSPEALQKSAAPLLPWQHCWPLPPQPEHAPAVQVPRPAPQVAALATHVVPAQQPPAPHVEFAQQGWFAPPHAINAPPWHTVPPGPSPPAGMQEPDAASRHAPPLQVVPPHAGWNAAPHGAHRPALHTTFAPPQVVPPQHG
jgi:hypothetical protein